MYVKSESEMELCSEWWVSDEKRGKETLRSAWALLDTYRIPYSDLLSPQHTGNGNVDSPSAMVMNAKENNVKASI